MRTVETKLYNIDELTQEARDKAIATWIDQNDYPDLEEAMSDKLAELLAENNITCIDDSAKPLYSLGYSQGDGAMFTGHFRWGVWEFEVRHSGHYYHERSSSVWNAKSVNTGKEMTDKASSHWNVLYIKICVALRDYGYDYIEYERDPDYVTDHLRANDYEFYANGEFYRER